MYGHSPSPLSRRRHPLSTSKTARALTHVVEDLRFEGHGAVALVVVIDASGVTVLVESVLHMAAGI